MSGKPGKAQPTYTAEFRADAVRLAEQGDQRLRQVATDLGLAGVPATLGAAGPHRRRPWLRDGTDLGSQPRCVVARR